MRRPFVATLITDPAIEDEVRRRRSLCGADRYDEVWDGITMMTPLADNEHQLIATQLSAALCQLVGDGGRVLCGTNVSDRKTGWEENFRIPDVAVFLSRTKARDLGTHWMGGPDFMAEIASPNDHSLEKFPFYAKVGVREILIVKRSPWSLELFRRRAGQFVLSDISTARKPVLLASRVVPVVFRMRAGRPRPRIAVSASDGREWLISP
jgi:Uma2 family endonuclease